MKIENLYKNICAMLHDYDIATDSHLAEKVIADPHAYLDSLPFYSTAAAILIDCRADFDARHQPRSIRPVIARVIKNADKDSFQGLFKSGDKWVVCDGYRFIRLAEDITSLPHTDSHFAVEQFIPKSCGATLDLPSAGDLKAVIAAEKPMKGPRCKPYSLKPYHLGNGIWVNPQYLLDMMQALPGCTAYTPSTKLSPIYFKSKNGNDGILMPVRGPKEAC